MPQRVTTYPDVVTEMEGVNAALEANAADFPHLEAFRLQLVKLLGEARTLSTQQSALAASKQETTKRLQIVLDEGFKLTTFLRTGVKQRYGSRSEKLVEFGIQPFRGRSRTVTKVPPPKDPAGSPNPTSTPETTK